ncbi:MAG: DUF1080 domain-containing protein [Tannerella sp.]|nr:DUF1080 domain-containing protein [Tannerella sp.]
MKKIVFYLNVLVLVGMITSCGPSGPSLEAIIVENPQVDLSQFPQDEDGYYVLFDGTSLNGWRGYGKEEVPKLWSIDADSTLKITGTGTGEAHTENGGDLLFARKFKNFELSVDWKVSKGGNSGIFYLGQEVQSKNAKGEIKWEYIYISAPESQILDNQNHVDAKMGKDGNRQSSSLYDMIPAKPQNAKPFGEWNNTTITVFKGTVLHAQNGVNVVEYHLWTPQWTELLQSGKFKQGSTEFPLAFDLFNNCGGSNHEGYIALQDHGDDIWFRNIKIKILD